MGSRVNSKRKATRDGESTVREAVRYARRYVTRLNRRGTGTYDPNNLFRKGKVSRPILREQNEWRKIDYA